MNQLQRRLFLAGLPTFGLLSSDARAVAVNEQLVRHIVFGSCLDTHDHPMLDRALELPRDVFIFMGDNIYADKGGIPMMHEKYGLLKQSRFYQSLRSKGYIVATWDDHDFGENDGGANYRNKREAQHAFLNWLDEPVDSPRREQDGVYASHVFGPIGKRVQIILLDTRYFRSELRKVPKEQAMLGGPYIPSDDRSATMLGEVQWQWFERVLHLPAELRLIVSSVQFAAEVHGGECWANMPHEQRRMMEVLKRTRASSVIFLSGDRHWCEFSRIDGPTGYPLYDYTASSMTQKHPRGTPTPNKNRFVNKTYHLPNVGHLLIDWDTSTISTRIVDEESKIKIDHSVNLADLTST